MDVWQWFQERTAALHKDGNARLARQLHELPTQVVELRYRQLDAAVPEALAAVRAAGDPWLEVFVRHWHMQSRVFGRREGERSLGDAVALVDFSHRDEARGCPQSVCTVQDLAACYGIVDGPGWAPERIAVSAETLARIDASWACWDCISGEHADALRDAGDAAEALRFLDRQRAAVAAHANARPSVEDFGSQAYPPTLMAVGRTDDALALLDTLLAQRHTARARLLYRKSLRGLCLARLGRHEEARAALLPASEALEYAGSFEPWSETAEHLVAAGALPNDAALGATLGAMAAALDASGSVRSCLVVSARHGALAAARGERWAPRHALARMERCVPRLRAPLDALDHIARLRAAVATLDAAAPELTAPEAVFEHLQDVSLDEALAVTSTAHARWPDDARFATLYAEMLSRAGLRGDAAEVLERWMAAHAPTREVALFLGELLAGRDPAGFERFADALAARDVPEDIRRTPDLFRGLLAVDARDWRRAAALLGPLPALWPDAIRTRRALAQCLLYTGDPAAALVHLEAAEALDPGFTAAHWDRMVAATMLGDHAQVRASGEVLGLRFDSDEGPVDEVWEECVLVVESDDGRVEHRALRMGPVTVRIRTIPRPGQPLVYDDVWVFDARPLNEAPPADAPEEQRRAHRWKYPGVARLREGGYRAFELDGPAPDEAARAQLFDALSSLGCAFRGVAGEGYTLCDPTREGERVDGLYLCVAAPPTTSDAALHARLTALNASLPQPLCWEPLARAAGDEAAAEDHARRFLAYGVGA